MCPPSLMPWCTNPLPPPCALVLRPELGNPPPRVLLRPKPPNPHARSSQHDPPLVLRPNQSNQPDVDRCPTTRQALTPFSLSHYHDISCLPDLHHLFSTWLTPYSSPCTLSHPCTMRVTRGFARSLQVPRSKSTSITPNLSFHLHTAPSTATSYLAPTL